jgi:DNA-binding transcriptional regulator YiaG
METNAKYESGPALTIEAFKNRPVSLPKENPSFEQPTPTDVKNLRKLLNLSQRGLAKLVGVSYSDEKGSPTVRKWETAFGKREHRPMNYTAWRLMLIAAGVVSDDDVVAEIAEYRVR